MKVSEQLPPVLMREYKGPADLMAVFTRPAVRSELTPQPTSSFVADDVPHDDRAAAQARWRQGRASTSCSTARPAPARPKLAKVAARRRAGALRGRVRRPRRQFAVGRDRYRSPADQRVFLKGSSAARCCSTRSNVFPPISTGRRAADGAAGQRRRPGAPTGSVSGKAWVNQILESNPVPVIWVTNRIEQIDLGVQRRFQYHLELKARRPAPARRWCARWQGVAVAMRASPRGWPSAGADAGADAHRGEVRAGRPDAGEGGVDFAGR